MPASHARPIASLLALLGLALALAACTHHGYGDGTTSAAESAAGRLLGAAPLTGAAIARSDLLHPGRMFYPLAVGDRWDYDLTSQYTLVTEAGPQPPEILHGTLQTLISGTQLIGEREYFLQETIDPRAIRGPTPIPFRQDRSGLYSLDIIATGAPAAAGAAAADARVTSAAALRAYVDRTLASSPQRAAFERAADQLAGKLDMLRGSATPASVLQRGGPDAGELSYLRYPLYVGARWAVRESPLFSRVVLSRERIALPAGRFAAWRILGTSELFGPDDRVLFWYSSAGLLRIRIHASADAVDNTGAVIGRYELEQDQVLTALQLVAPGLPTMLPVTLTDADDDQ